jgi:PAS domain S-box-containing protein
MPKPLRLLLAEDTPLDAELLLRELRRADFTVDWERVESETAFVAALARDFDLVLSDFQMPQFDGLRALELLQQSGKDIPFILVSGTVGEDIAVEAIRRGAADYLLKDRLSRLGPAVARALGEARLQRDRKRAEAAFRQSEELYRTLLNASPDATVLMDLTGTIAFASGQARKLFGFAEPDLVVGRSVLDSVVPEDRARVMENMQRIVAEGTIGVREYRLIRKDGTLFPAEVNAGLLTEAGGRPNGILLVVRDISARRAAEAALRESESRFRQVVETIQEVFWLYDLGQAQMIYVSPGYERIWGRTCDSLYAAEPRWFDTLHPEDRAAAEAAWLGAGLKSRKYRIVRPDGSVRWIHDRAFPVRDESGAVRRIAGVAEDVTDKQSLEERFLRAQRLEAVGTLSSGIAHDLNNILAPVLMIAPLLREKLTDPADREMLGIVTQSATRGAGIVRQLLTFSRGIGGERGPVPVLNLVRETAAMMRETFPREIEIAVNTAAQLWTMVADATQVHQVLMNLCVNARDAMPDGGRLTLAVENVFVDEASAAAWPEARPGPHLALSVTDNGTGIAPEHLARIFEPFFTTKGAGQGTGLGLSTVLGIVRGHGGFATVSSRIGDGTCFRVFFPAEVMATTGGAGSPKRETERGRDEHILVVDDEENLREALRRALQTNGYRVTVAASGREALEVYSARPDTFDLVLTDVMMPGINGVELVRAVRALRPAARILVATGMVPGERQAQLDALGIKWILPKPFTVEEVLAAVRAHLAAPA